jgi:hypothetical protein
MGFSPGCRCCDTAIWFVLDEEKSYSHTWP